MALNKLQFDYLSFRQILESALGSKYQSFLAEKLEINSTTVNNWCSTRSGAGPSLLNRSKIDAFFKKRNLPPIDWQDLMLPYGTDVETYHTRLNEPLNHWEGSKEGRDLSLEILDLQKEILKLKKELVHKDLDIIKYQNEAIESRSECFHLKKKLDVLGRKK